MIEWIAAGAAGYVLGAKAGRKRYDQISHAYRTVRNSPITQKAVTSGRKAIAKRINPDKDYGMKEVRAVDEKTVILEPKDKYGE